MLRKLFGALTGKKGNDPGKPEDPGAAGKQSAAPPPPAAGLGPVHATPQPPSPQALARGGGQGDHPRGLGSADDDGQLVEKLRALSDLDVDEEVRALALFVRAWLQQGSSDCKQAGEELADLMECGRNRAWVASLAGRLPFPELQNRAAGFCVERIRAGSGQAWPRALAGMTDQIRQAAWGELCEGPLSDSVVVDLAWPAWSLPCSLSAPLAARLACVLQSGNQALKVRAAAAMAASQSGAADRYGEDARGILRSYALADSGDWVQAGLGADPSHDHMVAALLVGDADAKVRAACEAHLLQADAAELDIEAAVAGVEALVFVRSPFVVRMLERACQNGMHSLFCEVALMLCEMRPSAAQLEHLAAAYSGMAEQNGTRGLVFGSVLGVGGGTDAVWASVPEGDPARAFRVVTLLSLGGDADAVVGLHRMGREVARARREATDSGLADHLDRLQYAIIGMLAISPNASGEAAGLRWKVLTDLLRVQSDREGDLASMCDQNALLGLADLCGGDRLPRASTYQASERVEEWLRAVVALCGDADAIGAMHEVLLRYVVAKREQGIGLYRSRRIWGSMLTGDGCEPEDDQAAAIAAIRRLPEVNELQKEGYHGQSICVLAEILDAFPRLPEKGRKRAQLEAYVNYLLMFACGAIWFDQAVDADAARASGLFDDDDPRERVYRKIQGFGGRARELALQAGDTKLAAECTRLMEKAF